MGERGPVRDPDSRRGRREAKNAQPSPAAEPVFFPDKSRTVEELWQDIVNDLVAAGVPVKQKDAYAIECVANNLRDLRLAGERAEDPELEGKDLMKLMGLRAKLTKDVMTHLALIGATPVATMRLIKAPPKKVDNPAADSVNDILSAS